MVDPDDPEATEGGARDAASVSSADGTVALGDTVKIDYNRTLPDYRTGPAEAYFAKELKGLKADCYALVCDRAFVPRLKQMVIYEKISNSCLNRLVDHGVVYWPPLKKERYVFVYEGGLDQAFAAREESVALGMNPNHVSNIVLPSIANALQDFKHRSFYHGGLRLSNMYPTYAGKRLESVVIGDALSAPYAYAQPVLYNTIPQAMSDPVGRGLGTSADDVYAFGVCLALMLRQQDPLAGKSDDEIIKEKILNGSYAAITGKDRFTGAILELLRGVLHDDATQRWSVEEILIWIEGRRLSPKQHVKAKNAPRPLKFNDKRYTQLAPLAMDVALSPSDAVDMHEAGEILQWIDRSMEDPLASERYKEMMGDLSKKEAHYQDKVMACLSIALHPAAPIRYKWHHLMPDSIGVAMAEALERKQDIAPYIEILTSGIAYKWLDVQEDDSEVDVSGLMSLVETTRKFLKQTKIGHGVERAFYHLLPEAHCMSPAFENFYVFGPQDIVFAYDAILEKKAAPNVFIDRHMAAFLLERTPHLIEPYLYDLDSSDDYRVISATLACFATIQARHKIASLPHLTQAFVKKLKPIYARFHDREKREVIEKKVERIAKKGQLNEMAKLLNDKAAFAQDQNAFQNAMVKHQNLQAEYDSNATYLEDKDRFSQRFGRGMSAVISSILAGIVIIVIVLMHVGGGL